MENLGTLGRFLFAIAMATFGVQHFIYAHTGAGLGPPWLPLTSSIAYLMGAAFMVAAVSLAAEMKTRPVALVLGVVLLLRAVLVYLPKIAANIHDPGPWTSGAEVLALAGAAWALAGLAGGSSGGQRSGGAMGAITELGRFLFAICLVVFGAQHLMYGRFVAGLVPKWIPAHLFWAYFVGFAFIAAAIAIIVKKSGHLAASLLGIMFFVWVVILHAPRVAAAFHNGNEWTSAAVALAMAGGSFVVAGTLAGQRRGS